MKQRSEAWLHFTETRDGHGNVKAECNKCKALLACDQGTSSMWKHAELCQGVVRPSKRPRQRSPPCPPLSRSGGGSPSEREPGLEEDEEASRDLARMIALRGYDPSIVEDDHFRSFVRRLNPGFKVPSRCDIETICDGIMEVHKRLDKQFERIQEEMRMVYENRCKSSSDRVQEMGPEQQLLPPLPLPPCAPSRPSGLSDLHECDQEEASKRLARMIALSGHDPLLVEDECFRSFVACLSPGFRVPSCLDIQMVRDDILDKARTSRWDMLRRAPGKVNLAIGKTKLLEAEEVIYTVCHFIDDEWKPRKLVLDAHVHTAADDIGFFHCTPITRIIEDEDVNGEHCIVDRLWMVACDTTDYRFQDLCDDIHVDTSGTTADLFVDNVLLTIARCLVPPYRDPIYVCMCDEPTFKCKQEHQQHLSILGLDNTFLYHELWYALYCSLKILHNKDSSIFVEVPVTGLLCDVWDNIYSAIQRLSDSRHPTSNLCLIELLNMRKYLLSQLANATGDDADDYEDSEEWFPDKNLAGALKEAINYLDKEIQESYRTWSIPLVLDPRYKLQHTEELFRCAFDTDKADSMISEVTKYLKELYTNINEHGGRDSNGIDQLGRQLDEEYYHYVGDGPVDDPPQDFDILDWWKNYGSNHYPTLARMARDVLALPTCNIVYQSTNTASEHRISFHSASTTQGRDHPRVTNAGTTLHGRGH